MPQPLGRLEFILEPSEDELVTNIDPLSSSNEISDNPNVRNKLAADRTSLANERTLLAYIRTAIALLATGIGLHYFFTSTIPIVIGIVLVTLSALLIILGVRRFLSQRRRTKSFM